MKTCSSCNTEKQTSDFHRSSKSKDELQSQCKECRNVKSREYVRNNKERYKENKIRWLSQNKDKENRTKRLRRLRNKGTEKEEKRKIYTKQELREMYLKRLEDPVWIEKNRKRKAEFERNKRKDVLRRLESHIRSRTAIAIKGKAKLGKYQEYIGCSTEELKIHLEKQFKEGMTWDNWGRDGWHIDHILPVSSFDLSDKDQFYEAFHYTNLQPLWGKDNLRKGSKI